MTTTDKNLTESASTATSINHDDEELDDEPMAEQDNSLANKFGGGNKKQNGGGDDDEDWGEFAQDDDEEEDTKKDHTATTKVEEKPKYTFGASSGFGTKGWAATHQTIPTPSKQPTFGGFGSSTSSVSSGGGSGSGGFGGFKSSILSENKDSTSAPSFGSFAKATASPFATAAAAGNAFTSTSPSTTSAASPQTDTLHNNNNTTTTTTTAAVEFVPKNNHKNHADESNENSGESDHEQTTTTTTPATFGEGAKVKVPGVVQQTQVTTGEEDEDTIYQTKAKLLVLDAASGNWKERGVGTFRINMKEEETKKVLQTRLVMRTDSVYRVILNLLLFQGMKVFIMQDKFVRFAGFETEVKEDGTSETKLVSFALKLSNPSIAKEVCEQIISCIPHSSSSGSDDDSKA